MIVLKGYFDDSGDEEDHQHEVCSVAGYVATMDDWNKFEKEWQKVLDDNRVPYLHMREFAHFKKSFEKFKDNKEDRIIFLQSLINVMKNANLYGIGSVIRLSGLREFNAEKGICINAYSFNLYFCIMQICHQWKEKPIQITLDKTNYLQNNKDKALNYLRTDTFYSNCDKYIDILPLNCLTFREILPLQAADFLAWEARKNIDTKVRWFSEINKEEDLNSHLHSLWKWSTQRDKNVPPRKSIDNLFKSIPTEGAVWDYKGLCIIDNVRKHLWPL
jgi:hypothetical protein